MALVTAGAKATLVRRLRTAVVTSFEADRGWPSFWWSTPSYGNARALEFLAASGGIPETIAGAMTGWVSTALPTSAADAAWTMDMLVALGRPRLPVAANLLATLLSAQLADGGWPRRRICSYPRGTRQTAMSQAPSRT